MRNMAVLLVVVFFNLASALPAGGQTVPAEEREVFLKYQLTLPLSERLIAAFGAMRQYQASWPDLQERTAQSMKMTPAERHARLESDSKAMAILKENGLTAQEYMVGVPVLSMALTAAQGKPSDMVSPANLAFAKANLSELKPKMDAAGTK
jgi:hypothetical protein